MSCRCTAALVLVVVAVGLAHAQVKVGAMGDSITDEWSNLDPTGGTFGYSTTGIRNWVEFAEGTGKLDFGTYTAFTLVSGTAEVRRAGVDRSSFSWNFARGGASTEANGLGAFNTFFSSSYTQNPPVPPGAPTNFRTMAQAGTVQYGALILGGNDLLAGINVFTYFRDAPSTDPGNAARLDAMRDNLRTGLLTATNNGAAPVKMVLGDLFDVGAALASAGASFTPTQRANIRDNVIAWNARVDALAQTLFPTPMPVVSLFDWWEQAAAGNTIVHGIPIQAHAAPTSAINPDKSVNLTGWNDLTLPDGVHPAPIGAALLADRFIDAIRTGYGETGVTPYTSKQMVTLTGLDPQQAPIANAGAAYAITAHNAVVLNGSASTDPNVGDQPLLQYSWDINGDGVFGDATGVQPLVSWTQLHNLGIGVTSTYRVAVRVDDTFGGVTTSLRVDLTVAALPGDLNLDADVDISDVQMVAAHWLSTDAVADANGDGVVDISDVQTIAANWTAGGGAGSGAAIPVPEPPAGILALAASLAWMVPRGGRRR
ncbi:MAG: hypothetical protein HYX69_10405 [Planctomycetia bacterium]|nr:hypothetical protein [Planctomycetia bacterium]